MAPQIWKFIQLRGRNEGQHRPRAQSAPHLSRKIRLPGYCYISYTWGHTFTLLQGPNQVQTLCPPPKTPNSPGTSGIVHDDLAL